jgi:hypothetical protein
LYSLIRVLAPLVRACEFVSFLLSKDQVIQLEDSSLHPTQLITLVSALSRGVTAQRRSWAWKLEALEHQMSRNAGGLEDRRDGIVLTDLEGRNGRLFTAYCVSRIVALGTVID